MCELERNSGQDCRMVRELYREEVLIDFRERCKDLLMVELGALMIWMGVLMARRASEWILDWIFFLVVGSARGRELRQINLEVVEGAEGRKGIQRKVSQAAERVATEERKWREYLANPSAFWDNRLSKHNLRAPDFKHKVGACCSKEYCNHRICVRGLKLIVGCQCRGPSLHLRSL